MSLFLDFIKVFQVNQGENFVAVVFGFYVLVSPCKCFFQIFLCSALNLCMSCFVTESTIDCCVVAVLLVLILFRLGLLLVTTSIIVAVVGESRVLFEIFSSLSFIPDVDDLELLFFLR